MSDSNSSDQTVKPAYVPFATFSNFIGKLAASTVPPQIDTSVMSGMAGSTQAHLRSSLRFLGLIDENGQTKDLLRALVSSYDKANWPDVLGQTLDHAYQAILGEMDLSEATLDMLKKAFRDGGDAAGQVLEKSIRFFLLGQKDANRKLSPHLETKSTPRPPTRGAIRKRRKPKQRNTLNDGGGNSEESDPGTIKVGEGQIIHNFLLRSDLQLQLGLPKDLTMKDVDRLHKWLSTLPFE